MKKIYLILSIVFFCSCSKDDSPVQYNETNGYLNNIESVEFGILGSWKIPSYCDGGYIMFSFGKNNYFTMSNYAPCILDNPNYEPYSYYNSDYYILEEKGIFYLQYGFTDEPGDDPFPYNKVRIQTLNKTTLSIVDSYVHQYERQ